MSRTHGETSRGSHIVRETLFPSIYVPTVVVFVTVLAVARQEQAEDIWAAPVAWRQAGTPLARLSLFLLDCALHVDAVMVVVVVPATKVEVVVLWYQG